MHEVLYEGHGSEGSILVNLFCPFYPLVQIYLPCFKDCKEVKPGLGSAQPKKNLGNLTWRVSWGRRWRRREENVKASFPRSPQESQESQESPGVTVPRSHAEADQHQRHQRAGVSQHGGVKLSERY